MTQSKPCVSRIDGAPTHHPVETYRAKPSELCHDIPERGAARHSFAQSW